MSPFETAYFELYISDGLHNMKNMRTSNFFLGLTIFLLAACSSSIDEDLDIKKDVDDPVSEKTFSLLSVDVGYIENADALAGLIGDVNSDIAAIQRTGNGFPMKTAYALSKKGQKNKGFHDFDYYKIVKNLINPMYNLKSHFKNFYFIF